MFYRRWSVQRNWCQRDQRYKLDKRWVEVSYSPKLQELGHPISIFKINWVLFMTVQLCYPRNFGHIVTIEIFHQHFALFTDYAHVLWTLDSNELPFVLQVFDALWSCRWAHCILAIACAPCAVQTEAFVLQIRVHFLYLFIFYWTVGWNV